MMMRKMQTVLAAVLALGLGVSAADSEAQRAGSSGTESPAAAEAAEARAKAEQAANAAEQKRRQEIAEAKQRQEEGQRVIERVAAVDREKSCVIMPAMSDAQIAHCKWAWSFPPP